MTGELLHLDRHGYMFTQWEHQAMNPHFELKCSPEGELLVLEAVGEFDLAAREQVLDTAASALVQGRSVVLDLSNVTFIDASRLGTLVTCARVAANFGGRFTARRASGQVARLLEITGLTDSILGEPM